MDPLLSTKITIPRTQPRLVARRRLVMQLSEGQRSRLTLVSAPAGFGKTSLVAAWADSLDTPVAWLSLDRGDNDLARFLSYLIAAFDRAVPSLSDSFPELREGAVSSRLDAILTSLINALARRAEAHFLVLDDYHLMTSDQVHKAVHFLLDHLPPNLHVVIVTRADPPLPLARMRGRGQLVELRAADLRFSEEEALAFLADVMGLELRPEDVARLTRRTEGWIVGLQMAAISMRGRKDTAAFVDAFAGSHRYVMDYLLEEVWEQQSRDVQEFLLRTSVLSSMSASLCDALLDSGGQAQSLLESLERANLFIVALDERRAWFRYHRLFADLLHQRLRREHPEWNVPLHRAAGRWYEAHEMSAEAISHALIAKEYDRAAGLIYDAAEMTLARSEMTTFLTWIDALPGDPVAQWPELAIYVAWAGFWSGQHADRTDVWLKGLDALPEEQSGRVAALRAAVALYRGEMQEMAVQVELAQEQLAESDVLFRGMVSVLQAYQRLDTDGPTSDGAYLAEVAEQNLARGNVMAATMTLVSLAEIRFRQGRLSEAETTYERALSMACTPSGDLLPVAGQALVGLGMIALMRNDIDRAGTYALEGMETARSAGEAFALDGMLLLAQVRRLQGDVNAAVALLEQAKRSAIAFDATDLDDRMVALEYVHHWVSVGDLATARHWAESAGLLPVDRALQYRESPTDSRSRLRKYEMMVVARLLLAEGHNAEAQAVLAWAADLLEARGRVLFVADALAMTAVAQLRLGDRSGASRSLQRALSLSEPSGYLRAFVDAGSELMPLLRRSAFRQQEFLGVSPAFVGRVLQALTGARPADLVKPPEGRSVAPECLVEPLTERESAVLRLLPTHLSSSEIAQRLVVAPSTVRSHIKNIYSKLQVHSRDGAVQRARDLGLL